MSGVRKRWENETNGKVIKTGRAGSQASVAEAIV
jgi:hypothetical protein